MDAPIAPPAGSSGRAWRGLGVDGPGTVLRSAEVLRVDLPFRAPVATSVGVHRHRPLVLVHLVCRTPDGSVVDGWGECAALADRSWDAEDVDDAAATLADELLPALAAASRRTGRLVPVADVAGLDGPPGATLARAALETAVGDAHLRAAGRSLADVLGVAGARVRPGAVLGLASSSDALRRDLDRLAAEGFARAKVKVAPGSEDVVVDALADRPPDALPVQVDANGAYAAATVAGLDALDGLGLLCIEQPLGRGDLDGHRALADRLTTPICLDESLGSPADVVGAVTSGACDVVCVKPARLGGIGAGLDVIDWCLAGGVPWWVGGMFESGLGRPVLVALAALAVRGGPTLPGDLAPPATYLAGDLADPVATGRAPDSGALLVPVHDGPGVGPAPDPDALAVALVGHRTVPGDGR